ncbi:MAG: hypothetical protein COX49_00770, partial [bacterium (Candidatus Stahlbacteria) CG23_combo_of_CG06-09_8_20_14_all_40_9]
MVNVVFAPSAVGLSTGNLVVESNDPDEPTVTVALVGEGIIPPDIAVSPDSLYAVLPVNGSTTQIMTINNLGGSPLIFDISEATTLPGVKKIEVVPTRVSRDETIKVLKPTLTKRSTSRTLAPNVHRLPEITPHDFSKTATNPIFPSEDTIYYDDGAGYWYSIAYVYWAQRFTPPQGCKVISALVMTIEPGASCSLFVWDDDGGLPGPLVAGPYSYTGGNWPDWDRIDITTEYIDDNDFWVGIYAPSPPYAIFDEINNAGRTYGSNDGITWDEYTSAGDLMIRAIVDYEYDVVPWLSEDPTSGTIPSGGSMDIQITYNSTGLVEDTVYTAWLKIDSNDPDEPTVNISVKLDVRSDTVPPAVPTLISPEDSSIISDNTPEFIWSSALEPEVSYVLQYALDTNFINGVATVPSLTDTTYVIKIPIADTTFYWRVKAIDSVGNESNYQDHPFSFTVDVDIPSVPALLSPSDSSYINNSTPTFSWGEVTKVTLEVGGQNPGVKGRSLFDEEFSISQAPKITRSKGIPLGTPVTYTLQCALDTGFTNIRIDTSGLTSNTFASDSISDTTYYWRVEAADGAGNHSGFQENPFTFTVDTKPPVAPTLISPEGLAVIDDNTPKFIWGSTAGNYGTYTLEYTLNGEFTSGLVSITGITDTTYEVRSPLIDTTYYWRVKAIDRATNESEWSNTQSFTIDVGVPSVPALLSPSDSSYI